MKDYDTHGGDSLTDLGFFTAALLILAVFCAVMYWIVPPFAGWIAL